MCPALRLWKMLPPLAFILDKAAHLRIATPNMPKNWLEQYFPAVDGLRAVAVIVVLICHFDEAVLPSGYLGVDVFFVISGFVITASLLRSPTEPPFRRLKVFYGKRVKRLLPATLTVVATGCLLLSFFSREPEGYLLTGLSSLVGVSNISLYFNQIDYWGAAASLNPFTHTWSLGVEEQFYLVYPLILILFTRKEVTPGSISRMAALIALLSVLSFAAFIILSKDRPEMAYFLTPFRFWEMGLGTLVYFFLATLGPRFARAICRVPVQCSLLGLAILFFFPKDWGIATIAVPLLSAVIIIQLVLRQSLDREFRKTGLEARATVFIGKISFSLYLWHWVVLVIGRWTVGISWVTVPILIAIIFLLSVATYRWIESPLRKAQWMRSKRLYSVCAPAMVIIAISLFIVSEKSSANFLYLGTEKPPLTKTKEKVAPLGRETDCSRIRTIGNSHSIHLIPMLEPIGEANQIEIITKNAPFIIIPNGKGEDIEKLDSVFEPLEAGDILIISSRNRYLYQVPYLDSTGDIRFDHSKKKSKFGWGLSNWLEQLDIVISTASEKGVKVVHFLPLPEFNEPSAGVMELHEKQWFRILSENRQDLASPEYLEARFPPEYFDEIESRARKHSNFYLFDPMPYLQDSRGNYPRILNGTLLYGDTNHLSEAGARLLIKPFYQFLQENKIL